MKRDLLPEDDITLFWSRFDEWQDEHMEAVCGKLLASPVQTLLQMESHVTDPAVKEAIGKLRAACLEEFQDL